MRDIDLLTDRELRATADSIVALQLPNGMIQWFERSFGV